MQVDSCADTSSNSPSNPQSYSQLKTEFTRTVGAVTNCAWLNDAKCVQFATSSPPVEDGSCRSSSRSWFVLFVSCRGISRSLALVEAGSCSRDAGTLAARCWGASAGGCSRSCSLLCRGISRSFVEGAGSCSGEASAAEAMCWGGSGCSRSCSLLGGRGGGGVIFSYALLTDAVHPMPAKV